MNILYSELPFTVDIDNVKYPIYTDFRQWIKFSDMVMADDVTDEEKIVIAFLYFYEKTPKDITNGLGALMDFYIASEIPKPGKKTNDAGKNVGSFSYKYDGGFVLSAFRQIYNIDLRNIEYMHWWEFKALFEGLPDDCQLKQRIAYRSINLSEVKDNKERARIRKIQNQLWLPDNSVNDNEIGNIFGGIV